MNANNGTGPIQVSTAQLPHGIVDNGRHLLTQLGDLAGRAVQEVYHHFPLSSVISLVDGLSFGLAHAIANRVNEKWVTDRIMQKDVPFTPKETQYKNALLDGGVATVVVLSEMAVTKMLQQKALQIPQNLAITFIAILIARRVFRRNDTTIELIANGVKAAAAELAAKQEKTLKLVEKKEGDEGTTDQSNLGDSQHPPAPPPSPANSTIKPTFLSLLAGRSSISSAPEKPIHHLLDYAPSDFDSNVRRNSGLWQKEATQMLQEEIERSTQADYQLPTSRSLEGELIRLMIDLNAEQSSPIDFSQAENLGAREQLDLLQQALTQMIANNSIPDPDLEEEEEITEEDTESNISANQDDDASFINSEVGRLESYLPVDGSLAQVNKEDFLENKEERMQFLNRMIIKTKQAKTLPEPRSEMALGIRKLILVAQSYNPDLKSELEELPTPSEQLTRLYEELGKIEVPS